MDLSKTLSGMRSAKVSKRGTLLDPGSYVLRVKNTTIIQPFDGPEAFILEAEVVETTDPVKHPVGTERSWYQSFKFSQSAFSELKKFVYAILKLDYANVSDRAKIEKEVDPQIEPMLQAVIEGNKFQGQLVRCEVVNRVGKKPNPKTGEIGEYAQYTFTPAK